MVLLYLPLFDDATTAKGPGCDEGTNLRLGDFAVVPLMPTRDSVNPSFTDAKLRQGRSKKISCSYRVVKID